MDLTNGLRGYSNLVNKALKTMVKPTPASVTELAFTPGALAKEGALDGVHAILFYAQDHCVMQLTDADVAAVAGFASSGGLVITIGDWAGRQDANRNTGAKACPVPGAKLITKYTDALSIMYERVFGWANVVQATSSISRQTTPFVKDAAAAKGTVFDTAGRVHAPASLSATVTYFSALEMASAAKIPGERALYVSGTSTRRLAAVWTAPFGKGNVLYLGWNWRTLGWSGDKSGADWTTALEVGLLMAPACGHGACGSGSTAATEPPTVATTKLPASTAEPAAFTACSRGAATKGLSVEGVCVNTNCGTNRGPCKTNACKMSDRTPVTARPFNGRDGADGYCCNDFHAFCVEESCKWPLKGFVGKCFNYNNIPGSNSCAVGQKKVNYKCVPCSGASSECPTRAEIIDWARRFQSATAASTTAVTTAVATTTTRTTTAVASGYQYGSQGSLDCPPGTARVLDNAGCRAAAAQEGKVVKALNSATYPSGCWKYNPARATSVGQVFYHNNAANGRAHASAQVACSGDSTPAPPAEQYQYGAKGKIVCPSGAARIMDIETCRAAWKYFQIVSRDQALQKTSQTSYPGGCFLHNGKTMYFNEKATGGQHGMAQVVCTSQTGPSTNPASTTITTTVTTATTTTITTTTTINKFVYGTRGERVCPAGSARITTQQE